MRTVFLMMKYFDKGTVTQSDTVWWTPTLGARISANVFDLGPEYLVQCGRE